MRIAFVVAGGVDRSGRRYHDRACTYPLLGATIRDLGSPRGLRRQYDALVDALRRDGPFDVVHGYQALPYGLTCEQRRTVYEGKRPPDSHTQVGAASSNRVAN